jgi:cytochrome P450
MTTARAQDTAIGSDAGRIFIDGDCYRDLDRWHAVAVALRRDAPVLRVAAEGFPPFWAVTRHADIMEIERQHERFQNTLESVLFPTDVYERQMASGMVIKSLVHMDGSEHRDYRKLTHDWFKPANLRRLFEVRLAELARHFVDRMLAFDGACDFARDIALYYPLHVIMSILGVPAEDEPRMLRLTQQLFGNEDPEFAGADRSQAMIDAAMDFHAYFGRLTEARRAQPANDIATILATGTVAGAPLGDIERLGYYMIVATAGHDTTAGTLASGLEALMGHPEQLRALQDDPALIANAVDEMIRWATPVRHFMRHATEDYVLAGTPIAAGDRLLLSYLSGNRDAAVFPDPFRFDVRRANADEHIAFGTGVHFCLGAHLARMELRAFLHELLPRLEHLEPGGEPEQVTATFVGGLKRLPIRYRLRPAAPAA